jgi:GAF domain-containing protein
MMTLELQEQIKLLHLLNEINHQIRNSLDLEEVLTTACRLLGETFQCNRVSAIVKESYEEVMITRGEYNDGDYPIQLGIKVPLEGNSHLQILMEEEKPLAVTNFPVFPGLEKETQTIIEQLGIRSMLAIATRYQGRVNGIIGLHQCDRYREWTKSEQILLEQVAGQLAIVINQAQLYAKTCQQAERERLLRLIANQIRSTLDLDFILQTAVQQVRKLLNCDRVVIYQFKKEWEGEIVVEDLGFPWPESFKGMVKDDCFQGEYAERYLQGRVRAMNDIKIDVFDNCHRHFLEQLEVKSNLIVPIVFNSNNSFSSPASDSLKMPNSPEKSPNHLWGLLIAHECHQHRYWAREEIDLLEQLGQQLAIAIYQAELYAKVQETARESQRKAEQLRLTLEALKNTQQQLIQSEKMSSLGQMVAGVAHEINNANNFILANLPHASEYVNTLSKACQYSLENYPELAPLLAEIDEDLEPEFLEYIMQDFPHLIKSMKEGSDRIRVIVQNLRNFSRLDESERKKVNLNEGIESTLAILQYPQSPIKIETNYGEIPNIVCYASQINQVFFNVISNSLYALENRDNEGLIIITTWQSAPDKVSISIRDNGSGIPPEIQGKIFDPFFTTKPVGQGTGLGLSICYQVIVKGHNGDIRCLSQPGKGTEFIIELPLDNS